MATKAMTLAPVWAALDTADRIIERALGTDVPNDWHVAYRRASKARAKYDAELTQRREGKT